MHPGPVPDPGLGCGVALVQVEVGGGRHIGRVRAGKADVQEEGPAGIALREEVQGPAHGPGRGVEVLFGVPGPRDPRVPEDAVVVGRNIALLLLVEPGPVLVFAALSEQAAGLVEFAALEPHPGALGVEVSLAHQVGLVPGVGEFAGQGVGKIVGDVTLTPAHAQDAGAPLAHAGHDGGARREAGRDRGVRVLEAGAGSGEGVQVRGLDHRVSIRAEAIAAHLVGEDEDDVGSGHGRSPEGRTSRLQMTMGGPGPSHRVWCLRKRTRRRRNRPDRGTWPR